MATVFSGGASEESCSSGSSWMHTPRASAKSRADGVTSVPMGTRSVPDSGTSCVVITLRIHPNRSTIRKDHCNETPPVPGLVFDGGVSVGPSDGQFQRESLCADRSGYARRGRALRAGPGGDSHLRAVADLGAGCRERAGAAGPEGRGAGTG